MVSPLGETLLDRPPMLGVRGREPEREVNEIVLSGLNPPRLTSQPSSHSTSGSG
jgi:hypothetical protein